MTDAPESPRVLGGSATDDEVAAIAAVFAQLQLERAAAVKALPPTHVASAWNRSRRGLRRTTDTEGRWNDPR
ncbi:MAG TPA: acyl-CoA carboxylase subunit epsilon [Amnibacterium sp.]|nr:acyl-CoA carboxylase subunit epsilon [Amnibacterium sp.]